MNYSFPDELVVRPSTDWKKWVLLRDFRILLEGVCINLIPAGFRTDFASIPRIFNNIFPKTGRYGKPAVNHDHRYFTGDISRREADIEFYRAMLSQEVKKWKAWLFYKAVRMFAGGIWKKYRKNDS